MVLKLVDWLWGQLQFVRQSGQVFPGGLRVLEQVPAGRCNASGAPQSPGPADSSWPTTLAGCLPASKAARKKESGYMIMSLVSFTLC